VLWLCAFHFTFCPNVQQVIFSDPQAAHNATVEGFPTIDGKTCNCNLASLNIKDGADRGGRGRGRGAGRGAGRGTPGGYNSSPYGYGAGYGYNSYSGYSGYATPGYPGYGGAGYGDDSTNPYGKRSFQQMGGVGGGADGKRRKIDHQAMQEVPETYPQQVCISKQLMLTIVVSSSRSRDVK
jgi:hypothetical protein